MIVLTVQKILGVRAQIAERHKTRNDREAADAPSRHVEIVTQGKGAKHIRVWWDLRGNVRLFAKCFFVDLFDVCNLPRSSESADSMKRSQRRRGYASRTFMTTSWPRHVALNATPK